MKPEEILRIVDAIHRDKNIDKEIVFQAIESALVTALTRQYGEESQITIAIDRADGRLTGTRDGVEIDTQELSGRIGAQTAKQVIIQRIRDAEREMTFNEFKDRKGELITGIVRRFEKGNIVVDLGRAEAILPKREQVPTETYRQGDRIQAYVLDITRSSKSPQVVLTRTHPGLLMKLFELEVPEIYEGIVRIEACAREPGHRAKIAVSSMDRDVDPVGACVGLKGSRVQAVVQELKGEAIDIIPFHPDPARFIVYAIAPAGVSKVYIDEINHSMELIVPDDQLSKAIGRRGQNVRLAAQLTGWRIDIYSESRHAEMVEVAFSELSRVDLLTRAQVQDLIRHGYRSVKELFDAEAWDIAGILEVSEDQADDIIDAAEKVLDALIQEEADRRHAPPRDELPDEA